MGRRDFRISETCTQNLSQVALEMAKYEEIRKRILKMLRADEAPTAIAKQLGVSRRRVYRVKQLFNETGDTKARHGGGRPRTSRTPAAIRAIKARIRRNPRQSMRKLSRDFRMADSTMRKVIKEDLGMRSRAVVARHFVSATQQVSRAERARSLLNWLKSHGGLVHVFSDEKLFTIDAVLNRRNDRCIVSGPVSDIPSDIRVAQHRKHPASIMVLGIITSDGQKCPPIFVEAGARINAATYQELLRTRVLPWLQQLYPGGDYVFQQDGAPAHSARTTQKFLADNFANFWDKDIWPPSSPDLNPLDFYFWARVEREACRVQHWNLADLRASICKAWEKIPNEEVARAVQTFRRRLQRVVAAGGDFIE
jgi:transposase